MRSTPAPGCCIDGPVADPAAAVGDPGVKRDGGRGVLIVEVEGSGR